MAKKAKHLKWRQKRNAARLGTSLKVAKALDPKPEGYNIIDFDHAQKVVDRANGVTEKKRRDMKNKIRQGGNLGNFKADMYKSDPCVSNYQPTCRPKSPKIRKSSQEPKGVEMSGVNRRVKK